MLDERIHALKICKLNSFWTNDDLCVKEFLLRLCAKSRTIVRLKRKKHSQSYWNTFHLLLIWSSESCARSNYYAFSNEFYAFNLFYFFLFFLDVLVRTCVLSHRKYICCSQSMVVCGDGWLAQGLVYRYANKIKSEYMLTSFANTFRND